MHIEVVVLRGSAPLQKQCGGRGANRHGYLPHHVFDLVGMREELLLLHHIPKGLHGGGRHNQHYKASIENQCRQNV
ncbi:hypothetical protein D3C80_2110410 [compost metagenome]